MIHGLSVVFLPDHDNLCRTLVHSLDPNICDEAPAVVPLLSSSVNPIRAELQARAPGTAVLRV